MDDTPQVTILMGVRNGGANLCAQLDSFAMQDHAGWRLVASDDGSTDDSRAVMATFVEGRPVGQVSCVEGPQNGFAANYLSLLARLPADPGWVAFSDQDDVWLPDRLSRGLRALAQHADRPALYCSRTWVTSAMLDHRRLSPRYPRAPSFRNALVQNIAAGNTILLNPAAARLLALSARRGITVVAHDWLAYLLVSGAGGVIVQDDAPTVLYRQHGTNTIGANDGWRARMRRLRHVLRGGLRDWNDANVAALVACRDLLTPGSRRTLEGWQRTRTTQGAPLRLLRLARLGLYRQTVASAAVLWLATLIGRV